MKKKPATLTYVTAIMFFGLCLITTPTLAVKQQSPSDLKTEMQTLRVPFIQNQGQLPGEVAFQAKTLGGSFFVTGQGELVYTLHEKADRAPSRVVIKETLKNARHQSPRGQDPSLARINVFKGADPKKWRTRIPSYNSVSLGEVYKGIELTLKAYNNNIEKLYRVNPGADPASIHMQVQGAQKLEMLNNGELGLVTGLGIVTFTKPIAYQEINGKKKYVEAGYRLVKNGYGFKLGSYDPAEPIVIDPMLSTFLGGSDIEYGYALDAHYIDDLYVYVTGYTESSDDFPGLTGVQTDFGRGDKDAFVARLDKDLRVLDTTYLGGRGIDEGRDIAAYRVDMDTHYVYVVGSTDSPDFPGAAGGSRGGEWDAFIIRLSADLSVIEGSRWLGGSKNDQGRAIAVENRDDPDPDYIYVAGSTFSADFPDTDGSAQPTLLNSTAITDGFVALLNPNLSLLIASYLGGCSSDSAHAVAIHPISHDVYVAGDTTYNARLSDVTVGCFEGLEPTDFGGSIDTFVVHMPHNLTSIDNATYLGGSGIEYGGGLAINNSTHQVYVVGSTYPMYDRDTQTYYHDFPANAYQTVAGGAIDAYVARFDRELNLERATYFGGRYDQFSGDIMLESPGNSNSDVYISGYTVQGELPGTDGGALSARGSYDAFVALFDNDLTVLEQATYVGGSNGDESLRHGLDQGNDSHGARHVFLAGETTSDDFAAVLYTESDSTAQPVRAGSYDAFVARLNPSLTRIGPADIELQPRDLDYENVCREIFTPTQTVTVENMGNEALDVDDIFLTGAESIDYSIIFTGTATSCGDSNPVVDPGESCTLDITFDPSVINDLRQAELVVQTNNDPDEAEVRTALHGYLGPDIAIHTDPATPANQEPLMAFPIVEIGAISVTKTFTIQNLCGPSLDIASIQKVGIAPDTGEDFTLHFGNGPFGCSDPGAGSFSLGRLQSCSVDVEFEPTIVGTQEAAIFIFSNDLDESPMIIHLTGIGVDDLDANLWSHDLHFHDVVTGQSRSLPLVISNTGGMDLTITGSVLSDTANFSFDYDAGAIPCQSTFGDTIPSTEFCTAQVTFSPVVEDTFAETLTLQSTDPDVPAYVINLTGRSGVDSDGDGIMDIEESGDANNDGTADSDQPHVAAMHSYDGEHFVVLESLSADTTLTDVHVMNAPEPPGGGYTFPFGFYHFAVELPPGNNNATVTITLPEGQTVDTYVKHGAEACNIVPHYYDFNDGSRCAGALDGVDIDDNVITLHLVDGGNGDNDLVDDDRIEDPGAPAVMDNDLDGDGVANTSDNCPATPNPLQEDLDIDGIGDACDDDLDGDGVNNSSDNCPEDGNKTEPGACGCGELETDGDSDGTPDCVDNCPADGNKTEPGECGCGELETDGDSDGTPDCVDNCPGDANKTEPGDCGCGTPETDTDTDGTPDCIDNCPGDANKTEPGICDCGTPDTDSDTDGTPDCYDNCPGDANKIEPGECGCGTPDIDIDGDGVMDCDRGTIPDLGDLGINNNDEGGCGCAVIAPGQDRGLLQFTITGLIYLLPFGYLLVLSRRIRK